MLEENIIDISCNRPALVKCTHRVEGSEDDVHPPGRDHADVTGRINGREADIYPKEGQKGDGLFQHVTHDAVPSKHIFIRDVVVALELRPRNMHAIRVVQTAQTCGFKYPRREKSRSGASLKIILLILIGFSFQ